MISKEKENTKDWWEQRYQASDEFLYSKEPSEFLISHLDLIPAGGKVLEIGCGEGRNAVALALKKYQVTAIDFSSTATERGQKLAASNAVTINFRTADLDFFIPELLTFDAIVCINFKPPLTLLKNLARGLKQGGHLLMEVPLVHSLKTRKNLELFECYKPNELLTTLSPQTSNYQVLSYSELSPGPWGEKCFLVAKKTQLL